MDAESRPSEGDEDVPDGGGESEPDAGEAEPAITWPRPRGDQRAVIYPAYFDEYGRRRDNLDRVQPSRINWLTLIRAVPSFVAGEGRAFRRRVPDEFFTLDVDEDGTEVAVVACPCGGEPRVPLARCVECECERFYMALGARVLVANSPQDRESGSAEPPTPVVD